MFLESDYGPTEWFADFRVHQQAQGNGNRKRPRYRTFDPCIKIQRAKPIGDSTF